MFKSFEVGPIKKALALALRRSRNGYLHGDSVRCAQFREIAELIWKASGESGPLPDNALEVLESEAAAEARFPHV